MAIPNLFGKYVLITGAASGIGRACALAFAAEGASLILTDIHAEALEAVRQSVVADGACCFAQPADVADPDAMARLADAVHAFAPALDVLINNAGIAYIGPFADTALSVWQRTLDINVMGVVHGCHYFLPRMRNAGGARHVLNVASLAAIAPAPNMSAYAASKHAVLGLCDALALELAGTKVKVSAVCPGVINTDITHGPRAASISDEQIGRLRRYYRRHGASPDVVAAAMVAAVRRGDDLVLSGPYARLLYHMKRVSRTLVRRLTLADAHKTGYM